MAMPSLRFRPSGSQRIESLPTPEDKELGSVRSLAARLKLETTVLILLLFTFIAILFQGLFTSKTFAITPGNLAVYAPYAYGDQTSGGNSTAEMDKGRALKWACELRAGYAYPFCGYGALFDRSNRGEGIDLTSFQRVKIKFRYAGPGDKLQMSLINTDPRYSQGNAGGKPNQIQFPIRQGEQVATFSLDGLMVADWWAAQHHANRELAALQIDNVTALEFQPGAGAKLGHHEFSIDSVTFEGKHISQAQYYLLLLGVWILLIGAFLIHRFLAVRTQFERHHDLQLQKRRQLEADKFVAESASAAKSAFLANMSHELRTPLNAILGYAQLLERETLTDRQAAAARTINQSGNHLLTLITDILDLSKIEAGRLDLRPGVFDLPSCIAGIADMMRIRADEKGLAFVCAFDRQLPHTVVGDEKRLRQVLINLLGNAIKFTNVGEVSFAVSTVGMDAEQSILRVEVRDTGIGMKAEYLPRIFESFEQVGDAERRSGGTGLGLSISRQIVDLMGGKIEVESWEGKGSCFRFEVPLEVVSASAGVDPPTASRHLTGYGGSRLRLLVVDDDLANRGLLIAILSELGFDTDEASDGHSCIEIVGHRAPALVLTGLGLPDLDGFEVIRRLRMSAKTSSLPIIAFSANTSPQTSERAIDAGANIFLPCPIDRSQLMAALKDQLGLRWTAGTTIEMSHHVSAPEIVTPPIEQLQQLMQLAKAGNMRAIRDFVDELATADPEYRPYADQMKGLAAGYQSLLILDLVSQHLSARKAA